MLPIRSSRISTTMNVTIEAFWLMTPCVLVGDDMQEVCFLWTLFYTYQTARYRNREDRNMNMHVYWKLKSGLYMRLPVSTVWHLLQVAEVGTATT